MWYRLTTPFAVTMYFTAYNVAELNAVPHCHLRGKIFRAGLLHLMCKSCLQNGAPQLHVMMREHQCAGRPLEHVVFPFGLAWSIPRALLALRIVDPLCAMTTPGGMLEQGQGTQAKNIEARHGTL